MAPFSFLGAGVALILAVLDWVSVARGWRRLGYVTKPGVMVALLGWLWLSGGEGWFAWALIFSLAGDVFLMLPQERFIAGLTSFLLAHLAYSAGFLSAGLPPLRGYPLGLAMVVVGAGVGLYRALAAGLIRRGQPRLRPAIALYALALGSMWWAALSTAWNGWPRSAATAVALGATLFFLSDALLGWNRFVSPLPQARLKVRILYHLGQLLLVGGILSAM